MRLLAKNGPRRLIVVAVLLSMTAVVEAKKPRHARTRASKTPTSQPAAKPAAEAPAPPPPTTARELLQRLTHAKPDDLKRSDLALRCGLDFMLSAAAADGARAAALIEAVGYQPLPLAGDLPETPARPISPTAVKELLAARSAIPAATDLPPWAFEIVSRNTLAERSPAAAQWMLPDDLALVAKPVEDADGWLDRPAFVIIRLRAGKATIMGGTFLEALGKTR